ncbi:hypothetical protein Rhopal_001024-T1 [Rhodotorula paludigena]|uniref:MOSC domain-containing protein n=1 Tax=Rhodotorula paludigena TaxID=86838 RepID=A0AAV5GCP5_9BASI|nr:hypothetical protein Rhopal_001024-T1 [Rhodotorula paludigena]
MPIPRTASSPSSPLWGADRADRDREYPALRGTVHLDHAAAPPAPLAPVTALATSLASTLYSNPHSASTAGAATRLAIDRTRTRVLQELFGVPDDRLSEWDVVFTQGGATQGIRTVGEAWDWRPAQATQGRGGYEYLLESHTSLVSLIFCHVHADTIKRANPHAAVLVDAAAYSSTSVVDLGSVNEEEAPDFVVASVYKIFGFPTSLGILLVRRASSHFLTSSLRPSYFGGGTLASLSLSAPLAHAPRRPSATGEVHQALEHGTPPYLEIVALAHALDWLARVTNGEGLGAVARHVGALREVAHEGGGRVFLEHQALRSEPGEAELDEDEKWRVVLEPPGPIVGFSLLLPPSSASASSSTPTAADADELDFRRTHVGHEHIARLALLEGIALRSGGMCNAGAVSRAVGMGEEERRQLEELGGARCWDEEEYAPFPPYCPLGITRISFGIASTLDDVHAFVSFVKRFYVHGLPTVPRSTALAGPAPAREKRVKRAKLTELYIYPIKSCAAQSLPPSQPWPLTPAGLLYDREFMLVSSSTGRALNQKRYPRMALIRPTVDRERGVLCIEADGVERLEIPLRTRGSKCGSIAQSGLLTPPLSDDDESISSLASVDDEVSSPSDALRLTTLCDTSVLSSRVSRTADAWFTSFLNPPSSSPALGLGPGPVSLHRLPPTSSRHAHFAHPSAAGAQQDAGPPLPLRLSNESPYLLVSEASLRAVENAIRVHGAMGDADAEHSRVNATAFRPNLVVGAAEGGEALEPWWEDGIQSVSIGGEGGRLVGGEAEAAVFSFLGRCRRCLMVSIDQKTGLRKSEPLATLSRIRKNTSNGRIEFGSHMLWRDDLCSGRSAEGGDEPCVKVGDEVRVWLDDANA